MNIDDGKNNEIKKKGIDCIIDISSKKIIKCLSLIKQIKPIKIIGLRAERIGHLAANTDTFFRRLQLDNRKKHKIQYIGITGETANKQLLKMYGRRIFLIQNNLIHRFFRMSPILNNSEFYQYLPFTNKEYYEFNNTKSIVQFTPPEEETGKLLLKRLGISKNSWFICFHSRDSRYLSKQEKIDCSYHDYRDCDINNYLKAAEYITTQGGYAVRMGHIISKKLSNLNNPRIIDYAFDYRTDFGDVYLPAKCKFFLGNTAGLFLVSTIFNVPVANANYIPFGYTPFRKGDLFIPKKIWSIKKNRFLTFREMLRYHKYMRGEQYTEAGLKPIENSPQEILELAKEMNERLDGNFKTTKADEELQQKFWSIFQPKDICYGSPARIGTVFLRQNKKLLD